MKELLQMFVSFCKIGALTFGGGYAMLPMLTRELAENRGWVTNEELLDYYAIGQCTPGIIAVNTATFVGYKRKGVLGGIFATLGIAFPSLVIITLIAGLLQNYAHIEFVRHAFNGIRVAVVALILSAVVKLWKTGVKNALGVILFLFAFISVVVLNLSPIWIVIVAVVAGLTSMAADLLKKRRNAE